MVPLCLLCYTRASLRVCGSSSREASDALQLGNGVSSRSLIIALSTHTHTLSRLLRAVTQRSGAAAVQLLHH